MSAPIVFVDTETTGLNAVDVPWEIAATRFEVAPWGSTARPSMRLDLVIDWGRTMLGSQLPTPMRERWHARVEHARQRGTAVSPERAAYRVAAVMQPNSEGMLPVLVGLNPWFDLRMLQKLLAAQDMVRAPLADYHLMDLNAAMIGALAARGMIPTMLARSDDLAALLFVEPPSAAERHTARGDVEWTIRIWQALATPPAAGACVPAAQGVGS